MGRYDEDDDADDGKTCLSLIEWGGELFSWVVWDPQSCLAFQPSGMLSFRHHVTVINMVITDQ